MKMTYAGQTTVAKLVKELERNEEFWELRREASIKDQQLVICYDKYNRATAYIEFEYVPKDDIIKDAFWNKELVVLVIWNYKKKDYSFINDEYIKYRMMY